MIFQRHELEQVLRLQLQSYRLLQWLNGSLQSGKLSFTVMHGATSGPRAAEEWLARNKAHLPPDLVPTGSDRSQFAHLLVSYLTTSFDLPAEKQEVRAAGCSCHCCLYLVALHRLVPRQPSPKDRKRAHDLKRGFLERLTHDLGYPVEAFLEKAIFSDKSLSLELSCATYGFELMRRTEFESQGCALLVLWRDTTWVDGHKPKKDFELTANRFIDAEATLRSRLTTLAAGGE